MDSRAFETLDGLLQRAHVLAAYRDGPAGRTTIADRAGCSRSTVYRAEQDLADRGLIENAPTGYRITRVGETVVDQFERCHAVVEGVMRLRPLVEHVDSPELIEHLHLLSDAELVEQEAQRPYHIEHRVREIIDGTRERMVGMTTGLGSPTLADAMIDRIRAGVNVDWILPAEMYDQVNAEYGELSAYAAEGGQMAAFVRERIPIDLALYDDRLVVIGFDHDRGVLGAVAITDDRSAVQWAQDIFDECRSKSEQVA